MFLVLAIITMPIWVPYLLVGIGYCLGFILGVLKHV